MSNNFVGIELRDVELEDSFTKRYVHKEDILRFAPMTDLSNENDIFKAACEYLEDSAWDVISCDSAKINEIYYS